MMDTMRKFNDAAKNGNHDELIQLANLIKALKIICIIKYAARRITLGFLFFDASCSIISFKSTSSKPVLV